MGIIMKTGINYTGGGGGAIADLITFNAQPYSLGQRDTITEQDVIDALLLDNMTIGTSNVKFKTPTITVGGYTWSEPDEDAISTATADVTLTFADGSSITEALSFTREANGHIYAAKPRDGAYIDTGLTLDYSYVFRAKGHTTDTGQSVLIGAFVNTSLRTTGRVLGASNKFSHMWPGSTDYTSAATGINFRQMFEYMQSPVAFVATQNGTEYSDYPTKTTTGTDSAPILLFNETPTADYNRGRIAYAIIEDGHMHELRHFEFYRLNGEIVAIDSVGLTAENIADIMENGDSSAYASHIYRPATGSLVQVYKAEEETT